MKERRKHPRIAKTFVISYFEKTTPEHKHEITQLKNISAGGMCFISSHPIANGTVLGLELKTPYVASVMHLEGVVLGSHEKAKNIIYEVRLAFQNLSEQSVVLLDKIMEVFMKEGRRHASD